MRTRAVFVSAGDENAVASWLPQGDRSWDLIVAFYGEDMDRLVALDAIADRTVVMKGGKFQNLRTLWQAVPGLLDGCAHIWVADDDLVVDPAGIERLFDIAARHDFAICQPALLPESRRGHALTRVREGGYVRLTNFVEVCCPLFRRDVLEDFLAAYDGSLVGMGIDWWFCSLVGPEVPGRLAVVDAVHVLNPDPAGHSINALASPGDRFVQWARTSRRLGIRSWPHRQFATIAEGA